jgi:hypothetical protein
MFIVDLRPWLDDSATTINPIAQGTLPISHGRQSVVMGNMLYTTSYAGLQVWDVTAAMDDVATTVVTTTTPIGGTTGFNNAVALAVYGSYAYVATQSPNGASVGPGTYVVDVSTPAAPVIIGFSSVVPGYYGCGNYSTVHHSSVIVKGTRMYLNANEYSWIMDLE